MQVFLSVEAFVPELRGLNRQEAFFLTPLRFGLLYVPALTHPNPPLYPSEEKDITVLCLSANSTHSDFRHIYFIKGPRECPGLSNKNKSLLFVTMGCYGRGEKSPEYISLLGKVLSFKLMIQNMTKYILSTRRYLQAAIMRQSDLENRI